jgi:hypothetical protein
MRGAEWDAVGRARGGNSLAAERDEVYARRHRNSGPAENGRGVLRDGIVTTSMIGIGIRKGGHEKMPAERMPAVRL